MSEYLRGSSDELVIFPTIPTGSAVGRGLNPEPSTTALKRIESQDTVVGNDERHGLYSS